MTPIYLIESRLLVLQGARAQRLSPHHAPTARPPTASGREWHWQRGGLSAVDVRFYSRWQCPDVRLTV